MVRAHQKIRSEIICKPRDGAHGRGGRAVLHGQYNVPTKCHRPEKIVCTPHREKAHSRRSVRCPSGPGIVSIGR